MEIEVENEKSRKALLKEVDLFKKIALKYKRKGAKDENK